MDIHSQLQTADFVIIGIYAVVVVGIGMWVSYHRRAADDLFLAERSLSWPNVGLSIFGTNVTPAFLIASCGVAYTSGMVAANFDWLAWWFLMLLAMLFIPYYVTTQVSTMPEFMRRRFGQATYKFLSWYVLCTTIVFWLAAILYAGGILLGHIMHWPLWVAVLVLTAIATSFTVAGGLAAVIVTDAIQSILMIVGATALTLIAFTHVGSVERLVDGVPASYWRLIRPPRDPQFPWPAVFLGYPVMGIWFLVHRSNDCPAGACRPRHTPGTIGLCVHGVPEDPYYLLISFYLFVGMNVFMILVSLLTQHSHEEESLPALKETHAQHDKKPTFVWLLWGILLAFAWRMNRGRPTGGR